MVSLSSPNKLMVSFHSIDDTFYLFNNKIEEDLFFNSSKIHPALRFILNKETDFT